MNDSVDLEWLRRKWSLPETARESVAELLREEERGSTACALSREPIDWSPAALPAGTPGDSPLVIVRHEGRSHLQSRRLFETERTLADRFLALAARAFPASATPWEGLFPGATAGDLQVKAARVALTRGLSIVTGGPGTGKTHTLARILALLARDGVPADRIRLAAPTGKAADRMKRAVLESLSGLPESFRDHQPDLAAIAGSSATIHSLLQFHPGLGRSRFDASHRIPCSVLILDECSMIDALLWRALVEALPPDGRLILLGDPNQLESVGQGNVFAELARVAADKASPLHPCHVHLTEARRFRDRPAILELAQALERSDAVAAGQLLRATSETTTDRGLAWIEMPEAVLPVSAFPGPIREGLAAVSTAPSPEAALAALGGVCILTAQREFFVGARAMSAAIEADLAAHPDARNHPVIINRNDPETGLRNGTVGVIHRADDGARRAYFPSLGGDLREFPVAALPDFSPAWAITIHRSQGSEYDHVLVILPQADSPLATRELLYTAITRARRQVYVAGRLAAVQKAVLTPSNRQTLLAFHLGA